MKKHTFLFLLLACIICFSTQTKAQGFFGHRFALGYTYGGLLDPFAAQPYLLTRVHGAELDFILNRSFTFGVFYSTSNVEYKSREATFFFGEEPRIINLNSFGLGLHVKYFLAQSGAIAPLGIYFSGKVGPYFSEDISIDNRNPFFHIRGRYTGAFVGAGRTSVIFSRLFLNFGIEGGLLSRPQYTFPAGPDFQERVPESWEVFTSRYMFQFKIGLMLIP